MKARTNVIQFPKTRVQLEEDAWNAYIAARKKADETLKLEDGRALALALRNFYELFTAEDLVDAGR